MGKYRLFSGHQCHATTKVGRDKLNSALNESNRKLSQLIDMVDQIDHSKEEPSNLDEFLVDVNEKLQSLREVLPQGK